MDRETGVRKGDVDIPPIGVRKGESLRGLKISFLGVMGGPNTADDVESCLRGVRIGSSSSGSCTTSNGCMPFPYTGGGSRLDL